MKIAILGSGAVGGYYGARLARAGHDVTFIARGAHLAAIREKGIEIRSPALGDFLARGRAEEDTAKVGQVDLVLVAIKTYDNATALPMLRPMLGAGSVVLTLQNGVDSAGEVAAVAGEERTLGGTTYIATALEAPGLIVQTGDHRRIVFGEAFGELPRVSERVTRIHEAFAAADIQSYPVGDGRVPVWEKFVFLASLAGFTGAARLPIGPVWGDPFTKAQFMAACREIEAVARAEGVPVAADVVDRIVPYIDAIPGSMRSSLLIDLQQGKRIEVEALQGTVVRRGAKRGVPTPIMSTLYAVLKLHAGGQTGYTQPMKKIVIVLLAALTVTLGAQGKEEDRLRACATVLKEIVGIPDDIPKDLLDKAECVIVFPGVKKVAVGVGGSYGRGAMTCRTGEDFSGPWSAPTLMALEGGSIGFQLGGQSTDFVLLVMNDRGATSVLGSKVKIGADASAAAGPKGRTAGASTDVVMQAEMLTYSRSRGLFAGVSLEGSTLRPDNDANTSVYGSAMAPRDLVKGGVAVPSAAKPMVDLLNQRSPKNLSDKK